MLYPASQPTPPERSNPAFESDGRAIWVVGSLETSVAVQQAVSRTAGSVAPSRVLRFDDADRLDLDTATAQATLLVLDVGAASLATQLATLQRLRCADPLGLVPALARVEADLDPAQLALLQAAGLDLAIPTAAFALPRLQGTISGLLIAAERGHLLATERAAFATGMRTTMTGATTLAAGRAMVRSLVAAAVARAPQLRTVVLIEAHAGLDSAPETWGREVVWRYASTDPRATSPSQIRIGDRNDHTPWRECIDILRRAATSPDKCCTLDNFFATFVGGEGSGSSRSYGVVAISEEGCELLPLLAQDLLRDAVVARAHRTETREQKRELRDALRLDRETGALNRTAFLEWLDAQPADGSPLAAVIVDIDGLRTVNALYGRTGGDRVLRAVTDRVAALRGVLVVSRWGGDEIALIVDGAQVQIETLFREIQSFLAQPIEIESTSIAVALCGGAAVWTPDISASILMERAEAALTHAKTQGSGSMQLVDESFEAELRRRAQIEMALRRANLEEELVVAFQPIVSPAGQPVGAEALVRWQSAELGLVSPVDFIPLATRLGIMRRLTECVVRTATAAAAAWPLAANGKPLWVSVNLSPDLLAHEQLGEQLLDWCHPGARDRFVVEITESEYLSATAAAQVLATLSNAGVRILLDDFGTGYSSLGYLTRYRFDGIKIDRSFVRSLPDDQAACNMARALTQLALALQLSVTVEGVETGTQRSFLQALGVNSLQGYLFSKPIAAEAFVAWVALQGTATGAQR
jgi:diguanylate cyclase (GGDEF)-like protein